MSLDLTLKNREFNLNVANSNGHKVYEFENFRLDASHRLLYRGGDQVSLTPKAVETLIALVVRRGEVVSKDELMQEIWADTVVEDPKPAIAPTGYSTKKKPKTADANAAETCQS